MVLDRPNLRDLRFVVHKLAMGISILVFLGTVTCKFVFLKNECPLQR